MPKPCLSTQTALETARAGRSHRATCAALGLGNEWRGTLHRIIHGFEIGRDKENTVRTALNLPPLPLLVETPACPVHGIAHCYDCNGYDDPVVTVRRQRKPPAPWVCEATDNLRQLLEARQS